MNTSFQVSSHSHRLITIIGFFFVWNILRGNYKPVLLSTYFISKQWLTFPYPWGFLWGNKHVFPLPVSLAVLAGGAEWGGGACRGGVSCCRGNSSPLGELGGGSERCWEGTRWRPADWWSRAQMWTNIQKSGPGPDPEGKSLKLKHKQTHVHSSCKEHWVIFLNSCYLDKKARETTVLVPRPPRGLFAFSKLDVTFYMGRVWVNPRAYCEINPEPNSMVDSM